MYFVCVFQAKSFCDEKKKYSPHVREGGGGGVGGGLSLLLATTDYGITEFHFWVSTIRSRKLPGLQQQDILFYKQTRKNEVLISCVLRDGTLLGWEGGGGL